jgi:hypothetical protein
MREVFNDLTDFATRVPFAKYPDDEFKKLTDCLATAGPSLYPTASDAAWTGWTQFGINGGGPDDPWSVNNTAEWMEYDPRNLTYKGHRIPIIEPCNTVSNLAYYRIIPDICTNRAKIGMSDAYVNAIIQGFATLGMGSSFMHGSRTQLGDAFDNIPIGVIAYNQFQLMTESLKPGANGTVSILHELSPSPRAYDGRVLAMKLHTIPLHFELNDWKSALKKLDQPDYFFTFGAIAINALTLIFPDAISDKIIHTVMPWFDFSPEAQAFLVDSFVPTIRSATSNLHLTIKEKTTLLSKGAGTVIKLLYAFAWQEHFFKYGLLYDATWNVFGALLIPAMNSLANKLTGFEHPDSSIQKSEAIYPGQEWCRVKHTAPHAKWHEESANGFMDLGYLANDVKILIDTAQAREASRRTSLRHSNGRRFDGTDDSSEVFLTVDVIDSWVAEMKAQPWSEGYLVTQAFALAVKDIVSDMDKCENGVTDGTITREDIGCYLTGISSAGDFMQKLYEDIQSYYKRGLSQVHNTPNSNPLLV